MRTSRKIILKSFQSEQLPRGYEASKQKFKVEQKKVFRPRFTVEELKILSEALKDYALKMGKAFHTEHTLKAFDKQRTTEKLWLNVHLLLNNKRGSGRRRNFRWSDQDLLNREEGEETDSC